MDLLFKNTKRNWARGPEYTDDEVVRNQKAALKRWNDEARKPHPLTFNFMLGSILAAFVGVELFAALRKK